MTEVSFYDRASKSLRCAVHIHDYRWVKNIGDMSFERCSRCLSSRYVPAYRPETVRKLDREAGVDHD